MFDGKTLSFVKNISQNGLAPGALTFQPDGKMLILSDRIGGNSYVTRYDPQTGAFNGVVGPGGGGLNRVFGIFYR
jgi:6-phosphogluconolactonase (cycloisomerase 2 family)